MKVKVVIPFHDADNFALVHKIGDVIDVTEDRAQKLQELGLVKCEVEAKVEKSVPEETETKVVEPKKKSRRNR